MVCHLLLLPKHFRCVQAFLSRPGPPDFFMSLQKLHVPHSFATQPEQLPHLLFLFVPSILIWYRRYISTHVHVWWLLHWWSYVHSAWVLPRDTTVVKNEWYLTCFPLLFDIMYFRMRITWFIVTSCVCWYIFFHLEARDTVKLYVLIICLSYIYKVNPLIVPSCGHLNPEWCPSFHLG